ncbi:hypothetical protein ELI_3206 [Eubacterium callanderi]|uniref:Uncharacterized protein n=1 Tax=Eubacterium callanderi TaxID=53442 RepID=E3GF41_9FIRM|nr:DUF6751 family protein [Eubacterium callanderi]ADO38175.1 hypothetical protein ELI_3206 [Eubacterium callanderi]
MIEPNADITIVHLNDEGPPDTDHIYGVDWQGERKTGVTDNGLQAADVITIFIPKSRKDTITMQKTDFVVRGIKTYNETGKALRRALEKDQACMIGMLGPMTLP